jgi:hypothetical protein
MGILSLEQGQGFQLHDVVAGDETASGTGAEATHLWYHVTAVGGDSSWVQAIVPSADEVGSDGRPSSWRFVLIPA